MNIISLDLATKMGWATHSNGVIKHGARNFSLGKMDAPGQRWEDFRKCILELSRSFNTDCHAIYFEKVEAHGPGGAYTAQVYGGWIAHLQHWCMLNHIPMHSVGVKTVKNHWTGSGNANKDMMIAEAKMRGFNPEDDNAADALGILSFGLHEQGIITKFSKPAALPEKPKKSKKKTAIVIGDLLPF